VARFDPLESWSRQICAEALQKAECPMIARRSAEEFLAELEAILLRFRNESSGMLTDSGRDEAVQRLRKLGFTAGQSLELLRGKKTP
jgi:hypothetical protein